MAVPRTGDPEAKPRQPAVPKRQPAVPTLGNVLNPNKAQSRGGDNIGAYIDNAQYPGLLRGEATPGQYQQWLTRVQQGSPDYWALIQTHGAPMQSLLWRAYMDNQDPNETLNQMTRSFGTSVFTDAGAPGPKGRGGRGGGGGGTAAPTAEQIAAAKAAIKNRSESLGHTTLSDDELTYVATTVVRDGWSSEQLDDWLLGDSGKITQPGLVTSSVDQIKGLAARQLLTVSDQTARDWAMRINSGEMTPDAVQSIFQKQALGEFGWAADSINAGISMKDLLAPARDKIAQELEIDPETVNLMDPKWRSMVTTTDPKSGASRAATLSEVTRAARKAPEWANTNSSKQLAANTFMLVRQAFEGG